MQMYIGVYTHTEEWKTCHIDKSVKLTWSAKPLPMVCERDIYPLHHFLLDSLYIKDNFFPRVPKVEACRGISGVNSFKNL